MQKVEAFTSVPSQGRKQMQGAMFSNTSTRITPDPGHTPPYLSYLQSQAGGCPAVGGVLGQRCERQVPKRGCQGV